MLCSSCLKKGQVRSECQRTFRVGERYTLTSKCLRVLSAPKSSIIDQRFYPALYVRDLYHASAHCAGLTASEIKVVELKKKPMMVFRCQSCSEDGGLSPDIYSTMNDIKKDLQSIKDKIDSIDTLSTQLETANGRIDDLVAETKVVPDLCRKVSALEAKIDSGILTCSVDVTVAEIQDRQSQARNVIIFKLPEPRVPDDSKSDEEQEIIPECMGLAISKSDDEQINSLLGKINNIDLTNVNTLRLGKPKPKANNIPRPLLVTLKSHEDALRVCRNRKLLPKGISVALDKTPMQRAHLKELHNSVKLHNSKDSEHPKMVKYIKGVPTIVVKSDPNVTDSNSTSSSLNAQVSSPKNGQKL